MRYLLLGVLALLCGACSATATQLPRDELGQMVDAQTQATIAAAKLQGAQRQATTQAEATRQFLILQGQQTRIAHDNQATATTDALRVNATATAQSVQTTQTRNAEIGNATATQVAVQFTATAFVQNIQAATTMQAVSVESTRMSSSATATAQAVNLEATRASASATATSHALSTQQTRTSADATATVIAAQVLTAQEKAEWDKRLEAGRAIASFFGWTMALIAIAVIVGFGVIRFIDAGVLRARVFRDKTGTVFVIGEKDEHGRQVVLIPGRSPGAALAITPPDERALLIEPQAVDADTTKRDQAVSLMLAATRGKDSDEVMRELTEANQVQFVDAPPAQFVTGEAQQLLEGDWKRLTDGTTESH